MCLHSYYENMLEQTLLKHQDGSILLSAINSSITNSEPKTDSSSIKRCLWIIPVVRPFCSSCLTALHLWGGNWDVMNWNAADTHGTTRYQWKKDMRADRHTDVHITILCTPYVARSDSSAPQRRPLKRYEVKYSNIIKFFNKSCQMQLNIIIDIETVRS